MGSVFFMAEGWADAPAPVAIVVAILALWAVVLLLYLATEDR